MKMLITFTDGTTEEVFCDYGEYSVQDGVLTICVNKYTSEWVHYPLANIRKYGFDYKRA